MQGRYFLWAGFKADDSKVHVDFGQFNVVKKFRLYANFKQARREFRFGAVHEGAKCTAHTSKRYDEA